MQKCFSWFKSLKWYGKTAVILVALIPVGIISPKSSSSVTSSSTHSTKYYKCRWCGKSVSADKVLTPNNSNSAQANVYTLENGFAFCSQDCFREWRMRQ